MKTISIQQQFDILLVAAQVGCTKLEAIAASKVQGWTKEVAALNAAYQDAVAAAKSAVAAL